MKNRRYSIVFFFVLALVLLLFTRNQGEYVKIEGLIHGTLYHIVYQHPEALNLKAEIEQEMYRFDQSLSTFAPFSTISKINKNETMETDALFRKMFEKAREVSLKTDGAFDITVAPLVNSWGFGYEKKSENIPSPHIIDSILQFVGFRNVELVNERIVKSDPRLKIDASAIAKGLSVDMVAEFLRSKDIKNFMVEIGGEIVTSGKNPNGKAWIIGIDEPIDDPTVSERKLNNTIGLSDKALATSGNYRNFYVRDGKKYSHTIDPKTGYPVQHSLLSATVLADDCMTADAWATACMVMGIEKCIKLAETEKEIELYLIYNDSEGKEKIFYTKGFEKLFQK
jgi:FAD:protein FMN transferase